MNSQATFLNVIKESTVLITLLTVVLFVWGTMLSAFLSVQDGVPLTLLPDSPLEISLLVGGLIALFFFFPLSVVLFLLLKGIRLVATRWLGTGESKHKKRSATNLAVIGLSIFAISILLLVPIARYLNRPDKSRELRVKSITLNPESKVSNKYEGLFFINKKDQNYIFIDKLERDGATIYILNEEEVKEIVLTRGLQ